MARRRVMLSLSDEEFQRLEQWASREERVPDQQATWLVRVALGSTSSPAQDALIPLVEVRRP